MEPYRVYQVSDGGTPDASLPDASTLVAREVTREPMGSKEKSWLLDVATERAFLLKYSRKNTGEHWSEKVAAEVAALLGVPHAPVDLGVRGGRMASLSYSFLQPKEALIHGNELLSEIDPEYPAQQNYRVKEHTLDAIRSALEAHAVRPPTTVEPPHDLSAFGWFVGYLMLDALVGNTDRHHENWGVVTVSAGEARRLVLAPSYDHASSLGRELRDEKRAHLLSTRDSRSNVAAYARGARSAIYPKAAERGTGKALTCVEAFRAACQLDRRASSWWHERLVALDPERLTDVVRRVPTSIISEPATKVATALLLHNLDELKRSP